MTLVDVPKMPKVQDGKFPESTLILAFYYWI